MTETSGIREYVVLERTGEGEWVEIGEVQARADDVAIREAAKKGEKHPQDGTYVAVPARSWQPQEVETETTVNVKIKRAEGDRASGREPALTS